jgi:ATP-binding cassette subfamily B protein
MIKSVPSTTSLTLRLFWRYATKYPIYLWPLLVILIISVLLNDFALPYITADVLHALSSGAYDPHNLWHSFGTQLVLYCVAAIAGGVIAWRINIFLIWSLENNVTRDIAQRVFSHLMGMSASFHANRFSGSLVSQANKLGGAYTRIADATVFNLVPLIVSLIATVLILAPRAPLFVVVLVGASLAFIIGTAFFSRPVREANAAEASLQSHQTGYLADSLSNISAVKTFARVKYEEDRYWEIATKVRAAGHRSMTTTLVREGYASVITQGIRMAAILMAVVGVGVLKVDVATIFLMVTFTAQLSGQLWQFQNVLRQFNRAIGDASDMTEILQIQPEITDPAHPEKSRLHDGQIAFKDMVFTHGEADEPLFDGINLTIAPGEKIGLVGRSGSGKTTLTRLLLRFSDLDSGSIEIDGQNIACITQDDLRRAISYVPQEPLLFHRSLRENIAYGKPDASPQQIIQATRRAHAEGFIEKLPDGYDTLVGERGVKLSGGQRQRIAIARAMLKDAPILVLDEATSALDSESEKLIQDALWSLMEGRTAIVIAHRLSTIAHMDRIVVLEEGAIREQGTHDQLQASGGIYAKLWAHQSGGFIEED